jgi:hypothetical protein
MPKQKTQPKPERAVNADQVEREVQERAHALFLERTHTGATGD